MGKYCKKTYFNATDSSLQSINLICCEEKKNPTRENSHARAEISLWFLSHPWNIHLFISEADCLRPCWTLALKSSVKQGSLKRVRETWGANA